MSVDKRVKYDVQGGVKNYLGKQKEVKAPLKWQSSPDHPTTELAYITQAEKDLLVKSDLHGSLKGGVNKGPSGIMSLNGYGSKDESQNVSGAAASAAETGSRNARDRAEMRAEFSRGIKGPALAPGVTPKTAQDFRSAAINAGAGQNVNRGFFDSRYNSTVTPREIALAKAYRNNPANRFAKGAYSNTRGFKSRGLGSLLMGGLGLLMGIPGLGLITGGLSKLGNLRGFNPDGTRRTQAEYEKARYDRQQQKRLDKLFAVKDRGYNQIGFGDFTKKTMDFTPGQQAKIDALMAAGYTPSTARNIDSGRGSGLRGDLNNVESLINATNLNDYQGYDLGLNEVPGYGVNRFNNTVGPVPQLQQGIMGIDVGQEDPAFENDLIAFNPGTKLDRTLKNMYSGYENLGIENPQMIDLMKQDLQQNQEKGTPLSLPQTAYSIIS
jgi:hypothetical protein